MKENKKMSGLVKEIIQNRTLIFRLSKNDFKTKFAGSYLGIIWAFIQPIVTVLVYIKVTPYDPNMQSKAYDKIRHMYRQKRLLLPADIDMRK